MKRLLLYGIIFCALVIGCANAFSNEQQEQNVENIQSISFNDTQDASFTNGRAFISGDARGTRGMPSGNSQSPMSPARMMQNPQRAVQHPSFQNDQEQLFADR